MKTNEVVPNHDVLKYYFYFIQERLNIFWNKCEGAAVLTKDPIFKRYKFTNVYRACDRVSQYLIKEVIYKDIDKYSPEDVLLRTLVFKIFNKIETWEYLEETYGNISVKHFDVKEICYLLSLRQVSCPIFSNAYMMTGTHAKYNHLHSKHEKWLSMVKEEFIGDRIIDKVLQASSLEDVYNTMRQCSFMGDFLAYQYSIDFNYTPFVNFSENSFVKAGIGAIRGIKKCFVSYGDDYEDAIRYVQTHFDELLELYGIKRVKNLPGHSPTLLDLQNCFCETDKYLRAKMPELVIDNVRIKQSYKPSPKTIHYMFPPKWNVEVDLCTVQNTQELTLFS